MDRTLPTARLRRLRRSTSLGGLGIAIALLLVGCGESSTHGSKTSSSMNDVGADVAPGAANTAGAASAASSTSAKVPAAGGVSAIADLTDRSVIRTAQIAVQTAKVAAATDRAIQLAEGVGGSVTSDVRSDGTGSAATADLSVSVPPESLETVLNDFAGLGRELSRQTTSQDVTTQVADVTSRVASARASITRLETLYSKANAVGDVIAIEGELSQREADLESLEAQQSSLASQTASARVTLHLQGTEIAATGKHHASGFGSGLSRGWHAFAVAAQGASTGLGAAIPFAVLLAIVAGAGLAIRRRLRSAVPPAPAE